MTHRARVHTDELDSGDCEVKGWSELCGGGTGSDYDHGDTVTAPLSPQNGLDKRSRRRELRGPSRSSPERAVGPRGPVATCQRVFTG
ncbi:hypothetical protein GN956_G10529 [Arapaima gigas]